MKWHHFTTGLWTQMFFPSLHRLDVGGGVCLLSVCLPLTRAIPWDSRFQRKYLNRVSVLLEMGQNQLEYPYTCIAILAVNDGTKYLVLCQCSAEILLLAHFISIKPSDWFNELMGQQRQSHRQICVSKFIDKTTIYSYR